MRHALVLGGSGKVGRAVVAAFGASDVRVTATCFTHDAPDGATAVRIDLRDPSAWRERLAEIAADDAPDVIVHCAATSGPDDITAVDDDAWAALFDVNVRAPFLAIQALAPVMKARNCGDVVLLGALSSGQSLPLPAAFATTQGALTSMAMATAKELGPSGVRVNVVSAGVLDGGLADGLSAETKEDYLKFSALRRIGTAAEVAKVVRWLALENTYLSGKVVPVNGGI